MHKGRTDNRNSGIYTDILSKKSHGNARAPHPYCEGFGVTILASRALTSVIPIAAPMAPPTACNPAKRASPPVAAIIGGGIKRGPMMRPATAVEAMEMNNRLEALFL